MISWIASSDYSDIPEAADCLLALTFMACKRQEVNSALRGLVWLFPAGQMPVNQGKKHKNPLGHLQGFLVRDLLSELLPVYPFKFLQCLRGYFHVLYFQGKGTTRKKKKDKINQNDGCLNG